MFGLTTMLWTEAFEPASCKAMLPQKFSAATTWTAGPVLRAVVDATADDEPPTATR